MSLKRVYILILNWNGWGDTIECLESVFRLDYPHFRVIVCDNASGDGSIDKITAWAEGRLNINVPVTHQLRGLSFPPVSKPVGYVRYDRSAAERGGDTSDESDLVLIETGANLGFAGGNNVGLRYALARNDFDFAWLLNNDTVVRPDAISFMVQRMELRPGAGMCGSTVLLYNDPTMIWALGGATIKPWLACFAGIVERERYPYLGMTEDDIEAKLDYLVGASMLVSVAFIRNIGLMCEDYFLYFEEPDWAMRGRGRYTLAYAEKSIVHHKVGVSTAMYDTSGSSTAASFLFRNYLRFTARFFPFTLPIMALKVFFKYIEYRYKKWRNPETKLS